MTEAPDHRSLLASLSPEQRRALTMRSDAKGLSALAMHVGGIVLFGGLAVAGVPGWPVFMFVEGVLLAFLFTLLHETVHRTAFATKALNDGVARICGFLLLIPPKWFRAFHMAHHRHTQDPENDPELATPKPETWGDYLKTMSGLPFWWRMIRTVLLNAAGRNADAFVTPELRPRVRAEARRMLAFYGLAAAGSVALGTDVLLHVWVLPLLLGQPLLRLYLLAEHSRCPYVANMLENSRTTFTNAFVRRLAWNMPYHAEHHAFPAVPFHRLPELHEVMRAHLGVKSDGYAAFHREYVAGLRG